MWGRTVRNNAEQWGSIGKVERSGRGLPKASCPQRAQTHVQSTPRSVRSVPPWLDLGGLAVMFDMPGPPAR